MRCTIPWRNVRCQLTDSIVEIVKQLSIIILILKCVYTGGQIVKLAAGLTAQIKLDHGVGEIH